MRRITSVLTSAVVAAAAAAGPLSRLGATIDQIGASKSEVPSVESRSRALEDARLANRDSRSDSPSRTLTPPGSGTTRTNGQDRASPPPMWLQIPRNVPYCAAKNIIVPPLGPHETSGDAEYAAVLPSLIWCDEAMADMLLGPQGVRSHEFPNVKKLRAAFIRYRCQVLDCLREWNRSFIATVAEGKGAPIEVFLPADKGTDATELRVACQELYDLGSSSNSDKTMELLSKRLAHFAIESWRTWPAVDLVKEFLSGEYPSQRKVLTIIQKELVEVYDDLHRLCEVHGLHPRGQSAQLRAVVQHIQDMVKSIKDAGVQGVLDAALWSRTERLLVAEKAVADAVARAQDRRRTEQQKQPGQSRNSKQNQPVTRQRQGCRTQAPSRNSDSTALHVL